MVNEPLNMPIAEYAKPIYERWDKSKFTPPEGFASWMEYWHYKYDEEVENGRVKRV